MPMDSNKEQEKKSKKERDNLAHRQRAYAEYLLNRKKYPLPFGAYEIHHEDFDKKNKRTDNLKILTPRAHDWIHDEHEEKLRRRAEKIEERLAKIKERQKERDKKKKRKIISLLVVLSLAGILILFLLLTSVKSPKSAGYVTSGGEGELTSLGYATIGKNYVYPEDISTLEKANEICGLRCEESFESVVTNFPLHFMTCYCKGKKYFVDTRTLEDLSSQEIASREKTLNTG